MSWSRIASRRVGIKPGRPARDGFYSGGANNVLEARDEKDEHGPERGAVIGQATVSGAIAASGRPGVAPELVVAAQRGDRAALEKLLTCLGARLLRVAERLTCDPGRAEELAAEALYRGSVRLRKLREPGAASAWFCRILVNLWKDDLRRQGRRESAADRALEPAAPPGFSPEAVLAGVELREVVLEALARLPPEQRAALTLSIEEGLSVAEIATALGTTPDRVKANLWHARRRLRELLASRFGEDLLEGGP